MNIDERGSFTELLKTENAGQFFGQYFQTWHYQRATLASF